MDRYRRPRGAGSLLRRLPAPAQAIAGNVGVSIFTQLCLLVSGVAGARMLGVLDRGRSALLLLIATVLPLLVSLGVPVALTYWLARDTRSGPQLMERVRSVVAVEFVATVVIQVVVLFIVFLHAPVDVQIAAGISVLGGPSILAFIFALAVLQGLQEFRSLNRCMLVFPPLNAIGLLLALLAGAHSLILVTAWWVALYGLSNAITVWVARRALRRHAGATAEEIPGTGELMRFGFKAQIGSMSPLTGFNLDQAIVGLFISQAALGIYSVASAFTNLPTFFAQSIGLVGYPHVASTQGQQRLRVVLRFVGLALVLCGGVAALIEVVLPIIIPLLYGHAFRPAIEVARILLISSVCFALTRVLSDCARGMGRPTLGTAAELISLVVLFPLVAVFAGLQSRGVAIALCCAAGSGVLVMVVGLLLPGRRGRRTSAQSPLEVLERSSAEGYLVPSEPLEQIRSETASVAANGPVLGDGDSPSRSTPGSHAAASRDPTHQVIWLSGRQDFSDASPHPRVVLRSAGTAAPSDEAPADSSASPPAPLGGERPRDPAIPRLRLEDVPVISSPPAARPEHARRPRPAIWSARRRHVARRRGPWAVTLLGVALAAIAAAVIAASEGGPDVGVLVGIVALAGVGLCTMTPDRTMFAAVAVLTLTISWNGIRFAGGSFANIFLVIAVAVVLAGLVLERRAPIIPGWLALVGIILALAGLADVIFPANLALSDRTNLIQEALSMTPGPLVGRSNLGNLAEFELGILLVPLLMINTARTPRRAIVLIELWTIGATINAACGIAHIGPVPVNGSRAAGLTIHPNYLALTALMAIPTALIWIGRSRWRTVAGVLSVAVLAGGVYVSGSRDGIVVLVIEICLTAAAVPRLRRAVLPALPVIAAAVAGVVALVLMLTHLGRTVLGQVRLGGSSVDTVASATSSNSQRSIAAKLALAQIGRRPLTGVGYSVVIDAQNIYLQLAASGGAVAVLAYLVYLRGLARSAVRGWRAHRSEEVMAIAAMVVGYLIHGAFDAQLADKYVYVLPGLLAAFATFDRRPATGPTPAGTPPTDPSRSGPSREPVLLRV